MATPDPDPNATPPPLIRPREEQDGAEQEAPPRARPRLGAPENAVQVNSQYLVAAGDDEGRRKPAVSVAQKKRERKKSRKNSKEEWQTSLCYLVATGQTCPRGDACKFSHDVQKFLAEKHPDIPGNCPFEQLPGVDCCPYGVRCRFLSSHRKEAPAAQAVSEQEQKDSEGKESEGKEAPPVKRRNAAGSLEINGLDKEFQERLRKKQVKFPLAEAVAKAQGTAAQVVLPRVTTEDSPIRDTKREKRKIDWSGKLYLPPLTTVGNLPFRRICKEYGADVTCGEMSVAYNLLTGQASEWALLRRHPCEDVFGVQLCGNRPEELAKCCELLESEENGFKVDFVDLNAACPIDVVYKMGCGSALLEKPMRLGKCLVSMSQTLRSTPLTVKLRVGKDEKKPTIHSDIVPHLKEWGVDAALIHGRSRFQRYTKMADWEYVRQCTRVSNGVTLMGSGDVFSIDDWDRCLKVSNGAITGPLATASIARAALVKPWVFTELKERRAPLDMSASQRLDMIGKYTRYGLEHWGSDARGVDTTRQFTCEWLAYLCKYVPPPLIDTPQRINDTVPTFRGRDDLETLLASKETKDWVRVTEMFLGPASSTFSFVPRKNANAV